MAKQLDGGDIEAECKQAFAVFDKDGDGFISTCELKGIISNLGEKPTDEELDEMVKQADADGDGKVCVWTVEENYSLSPVMRRKPRVLSPGLSLWPAFMATQPSSCPSPQAGRPSHGTCLRCLHSGRRSRRRWESVNPSWPVIPSSGQGWVRSTERLSQVLPQGASCSLIFPWVPQSGRQVRSQESCPAAKLPAKRRRNYLPRVPERPLQCKVVSFRSSRSGGPGP